MRKTKIVCTMGPATKNKETLKNLMLAGMNVARLNFSHETHKEHKEMIELIKKAREELRLPIAILLDTKGPEYRIKTFKDGKVNLKEGDLFSFTTDEVIGNKDIVSVNYKGLISELQKGDRILLNNGLLVFEVETLSTTTATCRILVGGELTNRKSMSFPNKVLSRDYLSEQDKKDILFGVENGVDFIACSFVSSRQDLVDVKDYIKSIGGTDIDIIAKIENRSGVDNIEEICNECDGIMIARGDMGVEIPFPELPPIQKKLITTCRLLGKRVITATEMLESMIQNPRPTRAEISDVANAVYDGTSAVMLSGETAVGKYPVKTVQTMSEIAEQTESAIHYKKRFSRYKFNIKNIADSISHATCGIAIDLNASAIAVCTVSGLNARMVSRFSPPMIIVGITSSEKLWRKLALSFGVLPVICAQQESAESLFDTAKELTKNALNLQPGSRIVVIGGNTNLIKIEDY